MKPCVHCKSTDRDSNGQCACRNAAYREARALLRGKKIQPGKPAAKKAAPKGTIASDLKALDKAEGTKKQKMVPSKNAVAKALAPAGIVLMEAAPSVAEEEVKALTEMHGLKDVGDDWVCMCGFEGKKTLPSIRSHIARAEKAEKAGTAHE
jgi:hypothetical protein